jgi:uncharacterized protein YaaR (DUF327 family)
MKITETSNHAPELLHPRKAGAKGKGSRLNAGVAGGSTPEFVQALAGTAETKVRLAMDEIMARLDEQGDRLVKNQTFEELDRYKELVKAFLDKLVNQLFRLQAAGRPSTARQRVNVVLQKVDAHLEAISKELLARQKSALRILEKLGQIKGLLLDLYQ